MGIVIATAKDVPGVRSDETNEAAKAIRRYINICMYMYIYICVCACVCACVRVCVYVYICVYIYIKDVPGVRADEANEAAKAIRRYIYIYICI